MENKIETNSLSWETTKIKGFASKQLFEKLNGGLKLIKVEPHSKYPVHNHPDKTEYIFVLEGSPEIGIGEHIYFGKPTDFFILPTSVSHSITNNTDVVCTLLVGSIKD